MLAANYVRHFKVLGKLCKFYDEASTEETAQLLRLARTEDQVATGESASLPGVEVLNTHYSSLKNSITTGVTAQKAAALATARPSGAGISRGGRRASSGSFRNTGRPSSSTGGRRPKRRFSLESMEDKTLAADREVKDLAADGR